MTAVIGLRCADGVVLCADQQLTLPGYYKYHETKIESELDIDWSLSFAYSGLPGLAAEARQKILTRVNLGKLDEEIVYAACDEVSPIWEEPLQT